MPQRKQQQKQHDPQQLQDFIRHEIKTRQVVIWSKSYCPHSANTKRLFRSMKGIDLVVHELDQTRNGLAIQDELFSLTGQRTVPNVFVNGRHIGGNSETQKANKSHRLQELLVDHHHQHQPHNYHRHQQNDIDGTTSRSRYAFHA